MGAHDSLYSSSSTVRTHLRLRRRGRFFPQRGHEINFSSTERNDRGFLSLSASTAFCYYRLCPQLHIPLTLRSLQLLRGLTECVDAREGRRSFWFMDGILIAKISFSLLEISVWKGLLYPTTSDYNRSAQDVSYDI